MEVRWSIADAARAWSVSYTVARKYVLQGRVKAEKVGVMWIILESEKPAPVDHLTPEQRAVWAPRKKTALEEEGTP